MSKKEKAIEFNKPESPVVKESKKEPEKDEQISDSAWEQRSGVRIWGSLPVTLKQASKYRRKKGGAFLFWTTDSHTRRYSIVSY